MTKRRGLRTLCVHGPVVRASLAAIALLLWLGGCTISTSWTPAPDLKTLEVPETAPMRIGVLYSPEFSTYEHVRDFGSSRHVVPIGASSVKMLDETLPRLFAAVAPVPRLEHANGVAPAVDAIVEPSIDAFDFRTGVDADSPIFSVTYRFNLYSPDGVPVASWTVHGDAAEQPIMWTIDGVIANDMRAAADAIAAYVGGTANGEPTFAQASAAVPRARRVNAPADDTVRGTATPLSAFADGEERKTATIADTGIIALQVELAHRDVEWFRLLPWASRLVLPDDRAIPLTSPSAVLSRTEHRRVDQGATWPAAFGLAGMAVVAMTANHRTKAREAWIDRLQAQSLQQATLNGDGTTTGALFFIPAQGTPAFDEATLRLWFARDDGAAFAVEMPVTNIGYSDPLSDE